VVAPVAADAHQHDPQLLAAAYSDIFTTWKDRRDGDDRGR
jgi:hypothetical protein